MSASPIVPIVLTLATGGLVWWSYKNNARAILSRRFKAGFDPGGPYTECQVRFNFDDAPAPCVVRTTREGWYMVTPDWMQNRPRWNNNVAFLKQAVFIPWESLDYYGATFPLGAWVRFDVRGTRALFFVRRDAALPLLECGGMPPPA